MLSILLINDNKIVSRLFGLSCQKHNYDLEEIKDYNPKKEAYNILFVDSALFDSQALESLRGRVVFDKVAYMGDRGELKPEMCDLLLEKPFLPTDFIRLIEQNFRPASGDEDEVMSEEETLDELDLDSLEEIDLDGDLSLDDADKPDLMTLSEDEPKEKLADMVADIDALDHEEESVDLRSLPDEDPESAGIVPQDLVKETLEEIEKSPEESSVEKGVADTALASVAAMATVAATSKVLAKEDDIEASQLKEPKMSEAVATHTIEKELDQISTEEMKRVINGDEEPMEIADISVNKVSAPEEKVVEKVADLSVDMGNASELEALITKAVAKAITKEVVEEALKDMDISISLRLKK